MRFFNKIRLFISVLAGKILIFAGRLINRGTSLPGEIALKLYPALLSDIRLPELVIAVSGSNGKTSTAEMITAAFTRSGKTVLTNKEGSNQIAGAATVLISNSTFGGKIKSDVLVLECDERYAKYIFEVIKPSHFVVTNLYRDQLTRNGHPFFVFDRIREAVELIPNANLVLNADDPIVSLLGKDRDKVIYFSMDKNERSSDKTDSVYEDCAYCPVCGEKFSYNFYHYAHLGDYFCSSCGYKRPIPSYTVESADFENKNICIAGEKISLAFESRYNIYNICAAFAVSAAAGLNKKEIAETLSDIVLKSGRLVRLKAGENSGLLLISKHENSVSYNQNIEYISHSKKNAALAIIVDSISRKYYTSETGWLWDIAFENLKKSSLKEILLCGKYAHDLAMRFEISDMEDIPVKVIPDLDKMAAKLSEQGNGDFYIMTCFSDKDKVFSRITALSPKAK
ncbi:MAG: DUF1727 domain-containing protein [Oscillospiraceae bacterium]|nr:DUF1727 domain-containing protein [Oscillospiraceae bacterium]